MEAPTGLLPNGRVDIYPGRLWAVAAAPTEMIQPAMWNIEESILMDETATVKDLKMSVGCVCILYLNLPTHCIRHDCYLSYLEAVLTVILDIT